jgi:hypothetical protein
VNARRHVLLLGGALLALAACPLPQPLPDVARVDGGAVAAPPRVIVETVQPAEPVVLVRRDCVPGSAFVLSAQLEDTNTSEQVVARWFTDYRADVLQFPLEQPVPAADDPTNPVREVQPFTFILPAADPAVPLHVVEVIVSNGFLPLGSDNVQNRLAQAGFETSLYRWTFQYVDATDVRGRCP